MIYLRTLLFTILITTPAFSSAQLGSTDDSGAADGTTHLVPRSLYPKENSQQRDEIRIEKRGKGVQVTIQKSSRLRVNKEALKRHDHGEVQRLIEGIEKAIGTVPDVDLRITRVTTTSIGNDGSSLASVHLTQFINGIEAAQSTFLVDEESFVANLLLTIVDPNQPNTDQRYWISLTRAKLEAKVALENHSELMFRELDAEHLVHDRTLFRVEEDEQTVTPLYIFQYHSYAIAVDALSGEATVTLLASHAVSDTSAVTCEATDADHLW